MITLFKKGEGPSTQELSQAIVLVGTTVHARPSADTLRRQEMEGLAEACKILEAASTACCREATPIFAIVSHAQSKVGQRLAAMLRGED